MDEEIRGKQEDLVVSYGNMDNGNAINDGDWTDWIFYIESFPIEVVSFIVDFALTASPRIIDDTYNSLCALATPISKD